MVDLGEKYNNNGIRLLMLTRVTPIQKYLLPNGTPCLLSRYVYKSSYYPMKPLLFSLDKTIEKGSLGICKHLEGLQQGLQDINIQG